MVDVVESNESANTAASAGESAAPRGTEVVASSPPESPAVTNSPQTVIEPAPETPVEEPKQEPPPTLLQEFDAKQAEKQKELEERANLEIKEAEKAIETKTAEEKPKAEEKAEKIEKEAKPDAKAEEKPQEKAKEPEPEPAAEPEVKEPEPEPFSAESLNIPEDFKSDFKSAKEHLDKFQELITKADLKASERAQGLVDLHAQAMRDYAKKLDEERTRAWNETQKTWQKAVMADEQIGGAGLNTALGAIARVRDMGLTTKQEREGFDQFLSWTGAGNNPWFLRWVHNLARFIDEPQSSTIPTNISPPPDNGQRPGRRARVLYDNSRSRE